MSHKFTYKNHREINLDPNDVIELFFDTLKPKLLWQNLMTDFNTDYKKNTGFDIRKSHHNVLLYTGEGFTNNAIDSIAMKLDLNIYKPIIKLDLSFENLIAKIVVEDNGLGVPEEEKEKLMKQVIESRKKRVENLWGKHGQFLYNANQKVVELNGSMGYENKKEGTLFYCSIPIPE